ncbi:MAG TPA: phosphatase PAP2 family protein [Gemmatimonadaceae bacterium]
MRPLLAILAASTLACGATRAAGQSSTSGTAVPVAARASRPTGQSAAVDSVSRRGQPWISKRDMFLASAFVLGATVAVINDASWDSRMQAPSLQRNGTLHSLAGGASSLGSGGPLVFTTGLLAGGRLFGSDRVADAGLHSTEAILLSAAATSLLKGVIGRARPYVPSSDPNESGPDADVFRFGRGFGADYSSFPSGHTTVAFTTASALTRELFDAHSQARWVVGPLLYGGATAVGLSRMYKNKHWASDVMAGAALGTFIGGKLVAYKHTHGSNRLERFLVPNVGASPTGSFALSWSLTPPR